MADKSPANLERLPVPACAEARVLVCEIADRMPTGTPLKTALAYVARVTGLSERRVRAIWHREVVDPRASEMDKLREIARARRAAQREQVARDELKELVARIATLEARLLSNDPDFGGAHAAALRASMRGAGGEDRAVDL